MMKPYYFAIFVYIAACGSQEKSSSAKAPDRAPVGNTAQDGHVTNSVTNSVAETSLLVKDSASLPACAAGNDGSLAYVKSEKHFYACNFPLWEVIDIRGEKGEKGDAGAQGTAGTPGTPGEAGAMGPGPTQFWVDQTTKKLWECSDHMVSFSGDSYQVCSPGFAVAPLDTLYTAWADGLNVFISVYIKQYPRIWSQNGTGAGSNQLNDFPGGTATSGQPGLTGLAACVHQ